MSNHSSFFVANRSTLQQAPLLLPQPNPTFHNPAFAAAAWRVLIVRLSPFRDVDRSTPHLFLAQAARRAAPDAYVDFAFLPTAADRELYTQAGVPWLTGLQSQQAAVDFNLILISNAYTLELINLPALLQNAGLPLWSSERAAGNFPLVLLGGSNAFASQAIVRPDADSLVDGIYFGEGEVQVEKLLRGLYRHQALPPRECLAKAARGQKSLWLAGAWPKRPITSAVAMPEADDVKTALLDYPLFNSIEAATGHLQISQGCPGFCSFCGEGFDRKPYREVPADQLLATARELQRRQGCHELVLSSFNFNTHADITRLILELNRMFTKVSFKSQRLDFLAWSPKLMDGEVAADKRSFTLGIEGISERMRGFLHKSLETQDILRVLERLMQLKIRELKLFFIITGHEKQTDIDEFRTFVANLRLLHRRCNPGIRIVFSTGLLVRLPGTPLQFDRLFMNQADWRQITGPVKSACDQAGFECRTATSWAEYATSQILAIGGYWLHEPLLKMAEQGYLYDEVLPDEAWTLMEEWLKTASLWDTQLFWTKPEEFEFPFAFVEHPVSRDFLYSQFLDAKEKSDGGYCLGADQAAGGCLACGACPDAAHRDWIINHKSSAPADAAWLEQVRSLMTAKARLQPVYVHARLDATFAGALPEWRQARLFQELLAMYPKLQGNLLAVDEALFSARFPHQSFTWTGDTLIACTAWDAAALAACLQQPPAKRKDSAALPHLTLGAVLDDAYVPGEYTQVQMQVTVPTTQAPNTAKAVGEWLNREGVLYTLRRNGAECLLEIPEKMRKKRILLAASYTVTPESLTLSLTAGHKFDFPALQRLLDAGANAHYCLELDEIKL